MKANYFKLMATGLVVFTCLATLSASAHRLYRPPGKKASHHAAKTNTVSLSGKNANNILFAVNDASVPEKYHTDLDKAAKAMMENKLSLAIGGHADKTGGYVYNWKLSKKRADAVKAYLVSKGCDSTKIAATEYGFTKPVASNKTPVGRKKNRRVEVKFI